MPEIDGETAEDEDRDLRRHVLAHGARGASLLSTDPTTSA
jgi:hypothetical protein